MASLRVLRSSVLRAAPIRAPCLSVVPGRSVASYGDRLWPHTAPAQSTVQSATRRCFHATSNVQKRDYFEVLGVKKGATDKEIKKAYFEMAKKYHPDTNKDDEGAKKKFQEAGEAYSVLSDSSKRQAYEQFGHAGVDNNGGGNGGGGGFGGGGFGGGFGRGGFGGGFQGGQGQDLNDLFEELFTGRRRGPKRGANMQYRLRLSFMEAVHGVEKKLNFQFQVRFACFDALCSPLRRALVTETLNLYASVNRCSIGQKLDMARACLKF